MEYLILILFLSAITMLLLNDNSQVVKFKKSYYKVKKYQTHKKIQYSNNKLSEEFIKAGFPFDLYKYQTVRITIVISLMLLNIIYLIQNFRINNGLVLLLLLSYTLSIPKTHIYKVKTPLKKIIDLYTRKRKEQFNREIGLFTIQLYNNFNLYQKKPPSAIQMIGESMVGMNKIESIFKNYIRYLQINKLEEGVQYLIKVIDTEEIKRLALILGKLDELTPTDLKGQLDFQKINFQEKRKINKKNKIKSQNYKITAIVSITLILMLLNLVQGILNIMNATDIGGII